MIIFLGVLLAIFVLSKNSLNPSPTKTSTAPSNSPSLVTIAPDFYRNTGTDVVDNPPTTSTNFNPATIQKLPTSNSPISLPDIQLARYHNDAAEIAPNPPPNPTFEATVPVIASEVYKQSFTEQITPRWLE